MLDELVGSFFGMPRDQAVRCLAEVVDVSFLEESSATHKMTPDNSIQAFADVAAFLRSDECPAHMQWITTVPDTFLKYSSRLMPLLSEITVPGELVDTVCYRFMHSSQTFSLNLKDSLLFCLECLCKKIHHLALRGLRGDVIPLQQVLLSLDRTQSNVAPHVQLPSLEQMLREFDEAESQSRLSLLSSPVGSAERPIYETSQASREAARQDTRRIATQDVASPSNSSMSSGKSEWHARMDRERQNASKLFTPLVPIMSQVESVLYIDGTEQDKFFKIFQLAMEDMNVNYMYVSTRKKSDNVSPNREFFVQYLTDEAFRRSKKIGPDLKIKLDSMLSRPFLVFTQASDTSMDSLIESRFARDPLCKFVVAPTMVDWDGWTVDREPFVLSKYNVRGYTATNGEGRLVLEPEPAALSAQVETNIDQWLGAFGRVKALGSWDACKAEYAPIANKKKLTDPFQIVLRQVHNYVIRRRDPVKEAKTFDSIEWSQVASAVMRATRQQ